MKTFNEKYTVINFIDKNEWSNVYLGINNKANQKIIINVLINIDENKDKIEEIKNDIKYLKEIDSPNLVSINNMFRYTNKDKIYYCIESEYFEGLTLKELREVSELSETQYLQIIREVIKGVLELNKSNINYTNLTQENIIINSDGVVKVNILGLINNYQGHLNYKSEELRQFDENKDVFTIGKILYEIIANKKNFDKKENTYELNEDLEEILEKCTNEKDRYTHKYEDLDEFLLDITSYLGYGILSREKNSNLEIRSFNSKIKKSIAICSSLIILIVGIVFGGKYFINKKEKSEFKNINNIVNENEKTTNTNELDNNIIIPNTNTNHEDNIIDNDKNEENNNENNENSNNIGIEENSENGKVEEGAEEVPVEDIDKDEDNNQDEDDENPDDGNIEEESPSEDNENPDEDNENTDENNENQDKDDENLDPENPDEDQDNNNEDINQEN